MLLIGILVFIFQASVAEIDRQQLKMNCPFPINAGKATFGIQNPPNINYTVIHDSNSTEYNVTLFKCGVTSPTSVSTVVYTADTSNSWFAMTNRASGYMFYISQVLSTVGERIVAFGTLVWLHLTAPSQVTGLAWFDYIITLLLTLIGLGVFMVVRG